eukprot:jgi/Ulvmu1/10561/UM065_0015.1
MSSFRAAARAFCWLLIYCIPAFADWDDGKPSPGQSTTVLEQPHGRLLQSMHCFNKTIGAWLDSADWKPSRDFLATGTSVQHIENLHAPDGSVLSYACEALNRHLDFTFAVPPGCPLHVKMHFADPTGTTRILQAYANDKQAESEYDIGALGSDGGILAVDVQSSDTGLLELALIPSDGSGPALISGIQIYATQECPGPVSKVFETTEEVDTAEDAALVVYRMACSALPTTPEIISTDLNNAASAFMKKQDAFVARVGDENRNTDLFKDLCLPATDADHLEFNLPLDQDVTYEVVLFFAKGSVNNIPDIIITVDGHEVFAESRDEFAPGPGSIPKYHSKRFEARAGPAGMQIVVSSLNGFPPISGMEVSQIKSKSGATGMTLLDRADNHIVVACGSKVFQQSPGGEILYPGPEAFTSAGLTLTRIATTITPADPMLEDLVAGGAFRELCTAAAGEVITATFNVQNGQEYTVTPYFAETSGSATVGSRLLDVSVDGKPLFTNIDIFKDVGLNAAIGTSGQVSASGDRITVVVTASVGTPMVSAIAVSGPAVDAAAADRDRLLAESGLARAAACGAAGPGWSPIEGLAAAGFEKFTTNQVLEGVPAGKAGLYRTHCFAPASDLTLQIPVVPGARLRVVLHFAEVFHKSPGSRVFDIYVNGVPQYEGVDLAAENGFLTPVLKEFLVVPTGPTMIIELRAKVQNPLLNGIEIYTAGEIVVPDLEPEQASPSPTDISDSIDSSTPAGVPAPAPFTSDTDSTDSDDKAPVAAPHNAPDKTDTAHDNKPAPATPPDAEPPAPTSSPDSGDAGKPDSLEIPPPPSAVPPSAVPPKSAAPPPADPPKPTPDDAEVNKAEQSPDGGVPPLTPSAPALAPAPAPPAEGGTRMVPVTFKVPNGKKECVASGKLIRIEGAINVDPPSVGFGPVAPANWQGNAAALRLTNSGKTQQTITHISCVAFETGKADTIPFFVIQFGEGGNAARVKCSSADEPAPVEPPFVIAGGNARRVIAFFEPTAFSEAAVTMSFNGGTTELGQVTMTGAGGDPWAKAHTLHPVVSGSTVFPEPDSVGGAEVRRLCLLCFH